MRKKELRENNKYNWKVYENEYGHYYLRGERGDGQVVWYNIIPLKDEAGEEDLEELLNI